MLLELVFGKKAEANGSLAQTNVFHVRSVGNLSCFVVSDFRSQRRDQHQRVLHVRVDLGAVEFDSFHHVVNESMACTSDQGDGVKEVVNHHWLKNVEFEISLRPCEAYGGCRTMYLHT